MSSIADNINPYPFDFGTSLRIKSSWDVGHGVHREKYLDFSGAYFAVKGGSYSFDAICASSQGGSASLNITTVEVASDGTTTVISESTSSIEMGSEYEYDGETAYYGVSTHSYGSSITVELSLETVSGSAGEIAWAMVYDLELPSTDVNIPVQWVSPCGVTLETSFTIKVN